MQTKKKSSTAERSEKKTQLKRYNLTLPESCSERIAIIRDRTEASSDSEVVRRAIKLYERIVTGDLVLTPAARGRDKPDEDGVVIVEELAS